MKAIHRSTGDPVAGRTGDGNPARATARFGCLCLALGGLLLCFSGCKPERPYVVVYAAQDRVFAEPVFHAFTEETGIKVRALYDNEATKTTGLANRLSAERARPQGDLWWSNEELRTRQLVRLGVLEPGWASFGSRGRVLVAHTNQLGRLPAELPLSALTNAVYRGQVVLAYPLFGTTLTHFLVQRQRWGASDWEAWATTFQANRPLLVDGNSVVVRAVARGDALLGLTDTDDVAAAVREGAAVMAIPLSAPDRLLIPNTVAMVRGSPRPEAGRRLAEYLRSPAVSARLANVGALDPQPSHAPAAGAAAGSTGTAILTEAGSPDETQWTRLLDELEPATRWLEGAFRR